MSRLDCRYYVGSVKGRGAEKVECAGECQDGICQAHIDMLSAFLGHRFDPCDSRP